MAKQNPNIQISRVPDGSIYLSVKLNKLIARPVYDFDVLLSQFGFLIERREDLTIYDLIERVRKYSDNFKTQLLCDAVERQAEELLGR
ncbi:hypothetical protein SHOU24_90 [Vibrio phage SHOU24]|uniref:hypothetical protein n=1 Tax=Vibrio phage SHOU24 TaxID=1414739 RepID=UPI0003ED24A1|nr:hypothetical protein SHOU24_90 [Vibrio phage SHOU24]AHI61287.1 hypothetical protein SHOU24_90 [Vibrio phage SHOU24]